MIEQSFRQWTCPPDASTSPPSTTTMCNGRTIPAENIFLANSDRGPSSTLDNLSVRTMARYSVERLVFAAVNDAYITGKNNRDFAPTVLTLLVPTLAWRNRSRAGLSSC